MALKRTADEKEVAGFDTGTVHGTFIYFWRRSSMETGSTQVWLVYTSDGITLLGTVKWFGRWRTYAFAPANDTIFETKCMTEIIEFSTGLMNRWRDAKKAIAAS